MKYQEIDKFQRVRTLEIGHIFARLLIKFQYIIFNGEWEKKIGQETSNPEHGEEKVEIFSTG